MDKYFNKKPELFRILFFILALILFTFSIWTFSVAFTSPTDENIFQDPPSRVYVTKNIYHDHNIIISAGEMITRFDNKTMYHDILQKIENPEKKEVEIVIYNTEELKTRDVLLIDTLFRVENIRILESAVLVVNVLEGGASDRADMKVGDLILEINNQVFNNSFAADQILRQGQTGKKLEYKILRNNQDLTIHVKLAKFGIRISVFIYVLCGFFYMAFAAFLGLKRPQFTAARYLGLGLILIGYFIAISLNQRDVQISFLTTIRNFLMTAGIIFAPALLLDAKAFFPKFQPHLLQKKWARVVKYVLAIIVFIATMIFGAVAFLIGVLVIIIFHVATIALNKKTKDVEAKKMSRVFRWNAAIAGVLSVLWFIYANSQNNLLLVGYIGIPLALIPLASIYMIGRYRLLDLEIRIRRNIQYNIVSAIWIILIIVFGFWMIYYLAISDFNLPDIRLTSSLLEITDAEANISEKNIFLMIISIIVVFFIYQFGKGGKKYIDKFLSGPL